MGKMSRSMMFSACCLTGNYFMEKIVCAQRKFINSWMSRCFTPRGSSTRFSLVGLAKVKAHKSFPFAEKLLCID